MSALSALLMVTDVAAVARQPGSRASVSRATTVTPRRPPTETDPTTTTLPPIPADWTRYQVPAEHFSIAVPTAWTRVDTSNPDFRVPGGDPSDFKFVAIDGHGSSVKVIVIAAGHTGADQLPEAASSYEDKQRNDGATIVAAHPATLAGLPTFVVDSSLTVRTAGGEDAIARITSYLIFEGDEFYSIVLEGPNGQLPQIAATFNSGELGAQATPQAA